MRWGAWCRQPRTYIFSVQVKRYTKRTFGWKNGHRHNGIASLASREPSRPQHPCIEPCGRQASSPDGSSQKIAAQRSACTDTSVGRKPNMSHPFSSPESIHSQSRIIRRRTKWSKQQRLPNGGRSSGLRVQITLGYNVL